MTVNYTSYEAIAVQYGMNMLMASATYATGCVRSDKSANYFDATEALTNTAYWTANSAATVTGGQSDPDGAALAYLVNDISVSGYGALSQSVTLAAGSYIFYVYAKAQSHSVLVLEIIDPASGDSGGWFDLTGVTPPDKFGSVTAVSQTASTNGYYICAMAFTAATAGTYTFYIEPDIVNTVGDARFDPALTGGAYICRPMLVASATATPPAYVSVPVYSVQDITVESVGGIDTQNSFKGLSGTAYGVGFFQMMAVVDPPEPVTPREIALHTYGCSGTLDVGLHIKTSAIDAPAEVLRRIRNTAGAIRSEVEAQFGGASAFVHGTVRIGQIYLLDETKYLKGYAFVPMTIDWESP